MIKNLLFDLGGVIMDIKKDNCVAAFKALGLPDTDSFFGDYGQQGPFMLIKEGRISTQEFHDMVRGIMPHPVTDAQIDDAFMQFLTGIPEKRLSALLELRKKYKVYLLSNTNRVMWDAKIADEFQKQGLAMEDYFDGTVTSFEAKCLKPGAEIFRYAQRTLGIDPAETLFLDDSLANVEAARALGFKAEQVADGAEFIDIVNTATTKA